MNIWPFRRRSPHASATAPPEEPSTGLSPLKQQAVQYLDATLAVLKREGIPLGVPVHGLPARGARFIEIPINLNRRRVGPLVMRKVLSGGMRSAIQAAARVDNVNAWQTRDAIIYQYQLDRELWRYYKRADLPAPEGIGLGVGRRLVPFSLGSKHTLVAGETRSGKSVTIESIVFALMTSYHCDEVGLVIIDPNQTLGTRKEGLQAVEVGSFTNAAHLLRPIAYSHQEAHAAIDYVYTEWTRRMRRGIQDGPGLVLIIDELMSEAVIGDKESNNHNEDHLAKLSQLASQGIKNNIFLVVGAQDPKIGNTSGLLMRNLGLRYIGHVTDATASRVLAGREGVNAHLLTESGDFVEIAGPTLARFQVAEPTRQDFERLERRPVTAVLVEPVDLLEMPDPRPEPAEPEFDGALLTPPEPDVGGNSIIPIDMRTLAIYFYEQKLSIAQADQKYGLKRRVHERHRTAALELVDEIEWLQAGYASRSPHCVKQES